MKSYLAAIKMEAAIFQLGGKIANGFNKTVHKKNTMNWHTINSNHYWVKGHQKLCKNNLIIFISYELLSLFS